MKLLLESARGNCLNALELALSEIREKRNILIAETDYFALSDHTLSSDMTTYRQSLRDITNGLDTVEKCNNVTCRQNHNENLYKY